MSSTAVSMPLLDDSDPHCRRRGFGILSRLARQEAPVGRRAGSPDPTEGTILESRTTYEEYDARHRREA